MELSMTDLSSYTDARCEKQEAQMSGLLLLTGKSFNLKNGQYY